MLKSYVMLPMVLALGVAGCGQSPVTRLNGGAGFSLQTKEAQTPQDASAYHAEMTQQAASLDRMMRDVVRNSTAKGALMGAAVGCGLVLVSSNNASNCAVRAAAGGLAGGVVGHKAGKRDATRRVQIVSANALTRSIRRSNDQMDDILMSLRDTLAQQEIEIAQLRADRDAGVITPHAYDAHVAQVKANRAELAQALSLSAAHAKKATAHLQEAAAKGQTGLEWHMSATRQLDRDIESARSQITLL